MSSIVGHWGIVLVSGRLSSIVLSSLVRKRREDYGQKYGKLWESY